MIPTKAREIAIKLLKEHWENLFACILSGNANDNDAAYRFHKGIFERSLEYIEKEDTKENY